MTFSDTESEQSRAEIEITNALHAKNSKWMKLADFVLNQEGVKLKQKLQRIHKGLKMELDNSPVELKGKKFLK